MSEYQSLGFYNGGVEAGASQTHKHLQLLTSSSSAFRTAGPIGPLLATVTFDGLGTGAGISFSYTSLLISESGIASTADCSGKDL